MKKLIIVLLAFLHLSASAGVSVHMHYCMGKLAGWDLSKKESSKCGTCGMEKAGKKNICCKDEYQFVKNNGDQKAAESACQLTQLVAVAEPVSFFEPIVAYLPTVSVILPNSNAPPDTGPAVYLSNCQFRI